MYEQTRRAAMMNMAALWLSACGGGEGTAEAQASGSPATTPTPTPVPTAAPTTVAAGAALAVRPSVVSSTLRQYLTWDAGDGPTRDYWSRHLILPWKNVNTGDWLDANGAPQGAVPYAAAPASAIGWIEFEVSALVRRCVATGENKGFMLRSSSTAGAAFSGRLSANPPQLVVDGRTMPLHAFACFSTTGESGADSRQSVNVQATTTGIVQFDLTALTQATDARLRLYCQARYSSLATINVYECDAPRIELGPHAHALQGVAAQAGSEAALRTHPDVLRAGDFSNMTRGVLFDSVAPFGNRAELLPDPDMPGSTMLRGRFVAANSGEPGDLRWSSDLLCELMPADPNGADPNMPPRTVEEEMFARLYVFLEDDFDSTFDQNKMALGWNLRLGWWNQQGYWQQITGNGGARGDGKRYTVPKQKSWYTHPTQYLYQGHSIRMEAGKASPTGNPYADLRPLQSYVYNLDQQTDYGDMLRLGRAVISKGRWHCIEQQVKMNSIVGPFDAQGNGEAVADGVLRTWVDGVLVSEHTRLRWRKHPQMGIQGPWINWFYGGKHPSEVEMHYRMNHLVVARRYIGPRVRS
jgi:hypothetical protein